MGLHYSERTYYDDPQQNADFIKYYAHSLYCHHNNYLSSCYKCKHERDEIQKKKWDAKQYEKYKRLFNHIHNLGYEFLFPDPVREEKVKIRKDDKFVKLKKSNSQEELKKEYFKLAKKMHPDKPSGSTKLFQKLKQLYDILKEQF